MEIYSKIQTHFSIAHETLARKTGGKFKVLFAGSYILHCKMANTVQNNLCRDVKYKIHCRERRKSASLGRVAVKILEDEHLKFKSRSRQKNFR